MKNAAYVKLDVLESNPGGKAFWAKVGFEPYSHSLRIKAQEADWRNPFE